MHDIVIRNGTVLDGTGGEPFELDVAISGDKIVDIGDAVDMGREELDAKGKLVNCQHYYLKLSRFIKIILDSVSVNLREF